jgi:hypothetical protein
MYESSCSYQSALDLKRTSTSPSNSIIKSEEFNFTQNPTEWNTYGFHQSTFERLKQSVEKAKAALQDRTFLGSSSAFSELYSAQRSNDSNDNGSLGIHTNNISINSSPLANNNNNNNNTQNSLNNNNNHSNNANNNNNNGLTSSNGNNQRLLHNQDSSQDLSKHRQQSKFFASLKIFFLLLALPISLTFQIFFDLALK